MKKLIVKNLLGEVTHGADSGQFPSLEAFQAWIDDCVERDLWGKKAYSVENLVSEALPEIKEMQEVIVSPEIIDEETGEVLEPARTEMQEVVIREAAPAIYETVTIPAEYTYEIEDMSEEVQQSEINAEALSFLNSTDWKVTRHRDQLDAGLETSLTDVEFSALLADRQAARERISN